MERLLRTGFRTSAIMLTVLAIVLICALFIKILYFKGA